ncbi:MAG: MmgE/PrpD family protein, partial [Polaromonas sp.]
MNSPTAQLAAFAAGLRFDAIPESVVRRAEDLLVDWFGSAVAGHGSRPVQSITRFAQAMGPQPTPGCDTPPAGPAEVIVSRARTSPYLAAMANAAASHVAEQDDVHNGSVFHPATVVFPAAVATAQALGASGQQLLTACVAGYEVG